MERGLFDILERYQDVFPFLSDVRAAADANRDALGFLPVSVYQEFARQGNLFVIVERSSEVRYAGHVLFARRVPRASVVQIFVLAKNRGRGLATQMLSHLKECKRSSKPMVDDAQVSGRFSRGGRFFSMGNTSRSKRARAPQKGGIPNPGSARYWIFSIWPLSTTVNP